MIHLKANSWAELKLVTKINPYLWNIFICFLNILIGRDLWRTLKLFLFQLQNLQYQVPQSNSKNKTKYLMIRTKSFSILSGSVTKWVISYCEIPETNHFANQLLSLSDCNTRTFAKHTPVELSDLHKPSEFSKSTKVKMTVTSSLYLRKC